MNEHEFMPYYLDALKSYDTMLEVESRFEFANDHQRLAHYRQKAIAASLVAMMIETKRLSDEWSAS